MRRKIAIRNGTRIPTRTPGNLPSGEQFDALINGLNAILNLRPVLGSKLEFTISDNNSVLTIPRHSVYDTGSGVSFHPFQIYSFPSSKRASPNFSSDWLKFRICAGAVNTNATSGTDGRDANPDSSPIAESDVADISVPDEAAIYWFWIDASTITTPIIDHGASGDEPEEWNQTYIPIGTVDTLTGTASKAAIIRQYVRTDIFVCPA